MLTIGSMFSGIGLLDLGLERAGMRAIWHAELDKNASKVLAAQWPGVPNLGDVTKVDWSQLDVPDVIVAGFPCPPFSAAGKRLGRDDDRYLWPIVIDTVRLLRPRAVLLENVAGLLSADRGTIFGEILGDLAEAGYDAKWRVLRASDVGAPHKRARVFVAAYAHGPAGRQESRGAPGDEGQDGQDGADLARGGGEVAADADLPGGRGEPQPAGVEGPRRRVTVGCGPVRQLQHPETPADAAGPGREGRRDASLGGGAEPVQGSGGSVGPRLGGDVAGEGPAAADPAGPRCPRPEVCGAGCSCPGEDGGGRVEPQRGRDEPAPDTSDLGCEGAGPARVGGSGPADSGDSPWGQYAPAIERWEPIVGRRAPDPLDDKGRLNVLLTEWMMGAPEGWCGDLARTAAMRGYGNAVVVQVGTEIGHWLREGMPS